VLTSLQVEKFTKQFRQLDADKNGELGRDDFEALVNRLREDRGWAPDSPRYAKARECYEALWEALKRRCDLDDNGTVSPAEWLAFHQDALYDSQEILFISPQYEELVDVMTNFVRETLDDDGDGEIRVAEYEAFLKAYGVDGQEAKDCFAGLDRNGDGVISEMELLDLVLEYYCSEDPKAPGNHFFGILSSS